MGVEIVLRCDGCADTTEDIDEMDLDLGGNVDVDHLPTGWERDDDTGEDLCPECVAEHQIEEYGALRCDETRPASPFGNNEHRCDKPAGHPGEHECHTNCMTWVGLGVAA